MAGSSGCRYRADGRGDGQGGRLGNGTTASSAVPVKVAGLDHATGIAAGIAAGWGHSVATQASGISAVTSVWT